MGLFLRLVLFGAVTLFAVTLQGCAEEHPEAAEYPSTAGSPNPSPSPSPSPGPSPAPAPSPTPMPSPSPVVDRRCLGTPWGDVAEGFAAPAFSTKTPTGACAAVKQTRVCINKVLSGTFPHKTCFDAVTKTISNGTNIVLQNLFTAAQWKSIAIKEVMIASGGIVGSPNAALPALRTGTGWKGKLTLRNYGSIQGAAGAPGGGAGGTAVKAEAAGFKLFNSGSILAGGGGGGRGGKGGSGTQSKYENVSSGGTAVLYYSDCAPSYWTFNYMTSKSGTGTFTPFTQDGWTYAFGGQTDIVYKNDNYNCISSIWHRGTRYIVTTTTTAGGIGGAGGSGSGYGRSSLSGGAGAAGSKGSGAGGAGGAGGGWGHAGVKGAKGMNGNAGAGVAGTGGGAAGYSIENLGHVTLTNSGTISGR